MIVATILSPGAIIDKMVNCTAAKQLDLMDAVYGDYMDGIESIVFNEGSDLTVARLIK